MNNVSHLAFFVHNAVSMFEVDKQIKNATSDINLMSLDTLDSKLSDLEEKILIVIFLAVIIFGFFGNGLVIWTVLLNKNMRTSNNLFILNLAVSDLTLCIVSSKWYYVLWYYVFFLVNLMYLF